MITLVVPPYLLDGFRDRGALSRNFAEIWAHARPNFVTLEGFVDAIVLVEGLKKAGKDLTREGPIEAIESLYDVDFGLGPQLRVDYSAKDHKGFDHVIPTVVRGGRALWRPS